MAGELKWRQIKSNELQRIASCVLKRKKINAFNIKLVAIVTKDNPPFNILAPSKFLVEYGNWDKVESIVIELFNGKYRYQVEIFKDGKILYSPALTSLTAFDVAVVVASLISFC